MAKLTLLDIENLQNESSVVASVNANNTRVEAAVEKTLSRDGTSPNQMEATLDMNSHRIINLPAPYDDTEPVRLREIYDITLGTYDILDLEAIRDEAIEAKDLAITAAASVNLPAISSGDAHKILQLKDDETGYELIEPNKVGANVISLLSVLTDAERTDVLSGTNSIDITDKINTLIQDTHDNFPGSTLDFTCLNGEMETGNWFAGIHTADVTLLTGPVTIKWGPLTGPGDAYIEPMALPSKFTWKPNGTIVKPIDSTYITAYTNKDVDKALVSTYIGQTTGSGSFGGTTLTVGTSDGMHVGTRIAITGIKDFGYITHTLDGAIDADDTDFTIAESTDMTIKGSSIYVQIDNEVIQCGAIDGSGNVSGCVRGALGTTAASHANGATIVWQVAHITRVAAINGTSVTVADAFQTTFTNAPVYFGSIDTTIDGRLEIDCEWDGVNADQTSIALGTTLSRDFTVKGKQIYKNCSFAGFIGVAAFKADINVDWIYNTGRPSIDLGSAFWWFARCEECTAHIKHIQTTHYAAIIDDKTSAADFYGLTGICNRCTILVDIASDVEGAFDIAGSTHCRIELGYSGATVASGAIWDHHPGQNTSDYTGMTGNVVIIKSALSHIVPTGDALVDNRIEYTYNKFYREMELGSPVTVPANDTLIVNTFNVEGVSQGDALLINPRSNLPAGISIAWSFVNATDTVSVCFLNTGAGNTEIPAQFFDAQIIGKYS